MKKIIPFIILGAGMGVFGDELKNWLLVFIGGMVFGCSLMSCLGVIIAVQEAKHLSAKFKIPTDEIPPKDRP